MTDATWQYTQGEVVLTVPTVADRTDIEDIVAKRRPLTTKSRVHIPLSKVSLVTTDVTDTGAYATFFTAAGRFYVLDSPEVRQALENTMFENVFKAGDDNDQD